MIDSVLSMALNYHRAGHLDQADYLCSQLTSQLADLAKVIHLRGLIANAKGQHDLCIQYATQAAALAPDNAEFHNLVGVSYCQAGRFEQAAASFRRAIEIQPNYAAAYLNCSLAYQSEGRFAQALDMALEAVKIRPDPGGYLYVGVAYVRLGRHDEAEAAFRTVLRHAPDHVDAWCNVGHVCKEVGRFDDATLAYQEVLRREPFHGRAVYSLSQIRRHTRQDLPWCTELETALAGRVMSAEDRISLHFALGKIYEDIGHYAVAFTHYQRGNKLASSPYDRDDESRRVGELIDYFSPEWFAAREGFGSSSDLPVFVVGMFRSGTTLVEQIVSSHSQVFGGGELLDMERIRADLSPLTGDLPFPSCVGELSPGQVQALANDYLNRRRAACGDARHVTDKMPGNILNLGLIALLFPRAKIIHCTRDPLDNCFSCYATHFAARPNYCSDLDNLSFHSRLNARLMDHWRRVLPMPILDVQYEDLVADQQGMSRRILEFCGLPWEDQCLRFFENKRPIQTSSDWQVRQPMYATAIGRWRRFAPYLGALLDSFDTAA